MKRQSNPTKQGLKISHLIAHIAAGRFSAQCYESYPWGDIRSTLQEGIDTSYAFVGDDFYVR